MFCDTVFTPRSEYKMGNYSLLIRKLQLSRYVQIVAYRILRRCIMYFSHDNAHFGPTDSSRMLSILYRTE